MPRGEGVRIIAGRERGRKLVCPAGLRVRPTSDRVREALFNILQGQLEGAAVLDLFAGTGAVGIEALSRGARLAVFVDNHPQSLATVRKNLQNSRFLERARVVKSDALTFLSRGHWEGAPYDLIFADPPYRSGLIAALLDRITPAVLAEAGTLVVEFAHGEKTPEHAGRLACVRRQRYGETVLSFYRFTPACGREGQPE